MKLVTLLGAGCGPRQGLTAQAQERLERAELVLGAQRLLDALPVLTAERVPAVRSGDLLARIQDGGEARICVVFSGDAGFHSGARTLIPLLEEQGINYEVLPGISSVQALSARLGRPWEDWRLCSAHGAKCDPVFEVCQGKPAFFLTGGADGPAEICRALTECGLGELEAVVGENLGYAEETLHRGSVAELARRRFSPLNVLLVQPAPTLARRTPGFADEAFLRDNVPMTKQEVRAAALAKLAVGPEDICWDVGAGTGSVSVELALQARQVWAVERNPAACALIRANRARFCAWNLRVREGSAVEVLPDFPAPDVVFVGGSGGDLEKIIALALTANPKARICVSAIALETLHRAVQAFSARQMAFEVAQIAVSRTRTAGELHLLMAQNPVFLITGGAA